MKNALKISALSFLTILIFSSNGYTSNFLIDGKSDSLKLLEQYSLFSEYYKNGDYESAIPFGWKVLEMDPARFSKWIYNKMEKCLTFMHDSSDQTDEYKMAIEDTILGFYDMAMLYNGDKMDYYQLNKAYVTETWFDVDPEIVVAEYVKAFEYNPEVHSYYYHKLGQIYKANISEENDYKMKAIDLYSYLAEREPENSIWPGKLEDLVEEPQELLDVYKRTWESDKENLGKSMEIHIMFA